jgi:hypothetical protein
MKFIPSGISNKLAPQMLKLEKGSPKILFGVGVVSMVGSTVLACRATLKLEEVLEQTNTNLHIADRLQHRDYSEEDRQKDKTIIYARAAVDVAKLYAPAVLVGAAGVMCLTKSHNMLEQRYAAVSAAYVALDKGFREYRARVVDRYGEQDDQEFRYGAQKVAVETDSGRKKEVVRVSFDEPSVYAKFFDQLCAPWQKEAEYNLYFLKCQQEYHNHMLRARGHVFLNEVYDALGIDRTKEGAVVGWLLGHGDDYIDFGVFSQNTEKTRDFVNGREGAILLDFNVDGLIYDLIEQDKSSWQH